MNSEKASASRMENIIIGAGAVGIGLAVMLSKVSNTYLVTRPNDGTLKSVHTFSLKGAVELSSSTIQLTSTDNLQQLPLESVIWIAVKAYDLEDVLQTVSSLPPRPIVILSNGLNLATSAREQLGERWNIIRACVHTGLQKDEPAVVKITNTMHLSVATFPESMILMQDYFNTLCATDLAPYLKIVEEETIAICEWKKVIVNATLNPLCMLVDGQNDSVLTLPSLTNLTKKLFAEVKSVANHEGFSFKDFSFEVFCTGIEKYGNNVNNTVVDFRRGRRSDLEYTLGRIISLARIYGIEVPTAEVIQQVCQALEDKNCA